MSTPREWSLVDATLRIVQDTGNDVDIKTKCKIAKLLDRVGVDFVELLCPSISKRAKFDCEVISSLGLKARTISQLVSNCHDVVDMASDAGINAIKMHIVLDDNYHVGQDTDDSCEASLTIAKYAIARGLEVFASIDNSIRQDCVRMLSIYKALDRAGVANVAVTDTSGRATPRQIYEHVGLVRRVVACGITICSSDGTGCAIANSLTAIEAGATHIATSCVGPDELALTNTASLAGVITRMIAGASDMSAQMYDITAVESVEELVGRQVHLKVRERHHRLLCHGVQS